MTSQPFWLTYRTELLGVTLQGPPPVGHVHVQLVPGVTSLYGLNGAGKSSVLRGLRSALGVIKDKAVEVAHLHLRIEDPQEPLREEGEEASDFSGQLLKLLSNRVQSLAERIIVDQEPPHWDPRVDLAEDISFRRLKETTTAQHVRWLQELELPEPDHDDLTIAEIAAQGQFILEPIGNSVPKWRVAIAASLDESAPALSAWAEKIKIWAWLRETDALGTALRDAQSEISSLSQEEAFEIFAGFMSLTPEQITWSPEGLEEDVKRGLKRPQRFSYPMRWIGEIPLEEDKILPPVIGGTFDADAYIFDQARSVLAEPRERLIEGFLGDEVLLPPKIKTLIQLVETSVNVIFPNLLIDAPHLKCRVLHPEEWNSGNPFRWEALDAPMQEWVPLEWLSQAQLRWARVAIELAFVQYAQHDDPDAQGFILLDEPEQALHARAERHVVHGLLWAAELIHANAIVATHSRELLNARGTTITRVFRNSAGQTDLSTLSALEREALGPEELGIDLADTLQNIRVFLAVEGLHDQEILNAWVGDQLRDAGVEVMPLTGAKSLEVANAHLIFKFTDAKVVVLLDTLGSSHLPKLWDDIQNSDLPSKQLKKRLKPFLEDEFLEVRAAAKFGSTVLDLGVAERLSLYGLSRRDIIEYLPVHAFLPQAMSWEVVIDEWKTTRSRHNLGLKDWMRNIKQVTVNVDKLRNVALDVEPVPDEIQGLASLCIRLAKP